jgi:serine/threonine protein kinase
MAQLNTENIRGEQATSDIGWDNPTKRLGQWELVEKAAEGKLADIYIARPMGGKGPANSAYAIKVLRPEWESDPRAVATIRREAQVGRLVSHPRLISILSAGVQSPPYYVVMPWLTGATLADRLAREGSLDVPEALWIARQAADALDALHTANWIHGDVKPSNIFISPEGHATLLDLGFARQSGQEEPTLERCIAGTGHYLAPEAFSAAFRTDIRSDLYSLGVTLYEMLCGEPPFDGSSAGELARQHRQARPPRLEEAAQSLPPDAALLLRQMLAKEPLRRPSTPREVVDRLVRAEIATLAERRAWNGLPDTRRCGAMSAMK